MFKQMKTFELLHFVSSFGWRWPSTMFKNKFIFVDSGEHE